MKSKPAITVGIVTRNRREELIRAIRSVYSQGFDDVEILVVDNASEDGTAETLRRDYPDVRVICLEENLGCPGGRNQIYAHSRGDYIVNLDDDGYLGDGALRRVVEVFKSDPSIGVVGMRQVAPGESRTHLIPDNWRETGFFRGGMSAFRRRMLDEIGVYPDDFFFFKEEEFLSLKALDAGWRIVYHPGIIMYHPLVRGPLFHDNSLDYYLYRNPLLVVVNLFPGLYMWKYLFLRIISYAGMALRRGSFQVYLRAVGMVGAKLARTLFRRRPVSCSAIRKYFSLRGSLPSPWEEADNTQEGESGREEKMSFRKGGFPRTAIVQNRFAHYRRALFTALCSQSLSQPRYVVYYGQNPHPGDVVKNLDPAREGTGDSVQRGRYRFFRNIWFGPDFSWQWVALMLAWGREYDVLILEGNMYFLSNWPAIILARLRGKRVLLWTHGFRSRRRDFRRRLRTVFYRLADGLLLYGERARMICVEKGFDPESLYVVRNSIDCRTQRQIRDTVTADTIRALRKKLFHADPDRPIVLWIGRMLPDKRIDLLLEAGNILERKNRGVNILLVGDGPVRRELQRSAVLSGQEGYIRFYGACYREETLAEIIMASDCAVAPGSVGLACMHCLVYGTPVITHNNWERQKPEVEAMVAGKTGDFFREGDAADLARAITVWFDRGTDRGLIEQDCYERVDRYYNPEYQRYVFNAAVRSEPASSVNSGFGYSESNDYGRDIKILR